MEKKYNALFWTKVIIVLFFMFGFGNCVPPLASLDQLGMNVLGIFIGLLFAWMTIGYIWPSLLSLLALRVAGYDTMNSLLAGSFGNNVTIFVLFIFIYTIYLEKAGLCERIAHWFLGRKFVSGHPWLLVSVFLLAAYVMTIMTYLYPAYIICWTIIYSICQDVGYKQGDKFPALLCIGVGVAGLMGNVALPIKSVPILTLGLFESTVEGLGYTLSFFDYSVIMVPMTLTILALWVLMMRFVFKADVSLLENVDDKRFEAYRNERVTKSEKIALFSVLCLIVIMCIPTVFPKSWYVTQLFKGFGMAGCVFVVLIALTLIPVDGKPIMDFGKIANGGHINWESVIMIACSLPLGTALGKDEIGITKIIVDFCTPLLEGIGPIVFCVLAFVLVSLITQVIHNLVCATIFTPILVNFAIACGVDPAMLTVFIVFAFGFSTTTPASSSAAAMIFLNEWIPNGLCYRTMISHFLLSLLLICITFLPLALFFM